MDYRLHRNCICRTLCNSSAYTGLGIRRFFRMGLTSDEIKNIIKREAVSEVTDEEIAKLSEELSENIIDARGKRSFYGAGRSSRMGRGFGRGRL
ncbi:hypothetical protein [Methanococcus maripaludis]|uniref:Uncharacterized protein n=1 Tax=Methanococcus maripaludis TaxID=39152 RepID=A0A7J9PTH3_METMI|nr:hypothetical protein [Methanococcus maripaludis]MBA2868965.1 hypothetical protein [Methanococcus maripaludis]